MTEPATGPALTANQSLWRVVADAIRSAPKAQRRGLAMAPLPIAVALFFSVGDILEGTNPLELARVLGLVLASAGYTVLLIAHVLHYLSQHQSMNCGALSLRGRMQWPFQRLESQVPDRIFQALPAMLLVSAALTTAAIGLYLPSFIARPLTLIMLPMFAGLLYLAFRAAVHTSRFLYHYAEEQAALAARAREEATEAQLSALQAQMNPHFLFNALNTVASLVRSNPRSAERTVEHLSDVLRRTLARNSRTTGTVAEEIDYLKAYLAVEQQRYGDRLAVDWSVTPEALRCPLPPLVLQPLVENALRHGLGARLEGGRLSISAVRQNGRLELAVSDDGAGLPNRVVEGTGLGNLRRRLTTLYGDAASLSLEPEPAGTTVRLTLPVRE
jgi:signal transduction histidine kinase